MKEQGVEVEEVLPCCSSASSFGDITAASKKNNPSLPFIRKNTLKRPGGLVLEKQEQFFVQGPDKMKKQKVLKDILEAQNFFII